MNSCDYYQELISRLVDGEVSHDEYEALMAHMKSCSNCNAMYAVFHDLSDILSEEPEALPAGLHENIMAGVRRSAIIRKNRRMRKIGMRTALTAAACLVLVLFAATGFNPGKRAESVSIRSREEAAQLSAPPAAETEVNYAAPVETAAPAVYPTPAPTSCQAPAQSVYPTPAPAEYAAPAAPDAYLAAEDNTEIQPITLQQWQNMIFSAPEPEQTAEPVQTAPPAVFWPVMPAPVETAAPAPAEYPAPAVPEPVQAAASAPEPVSNAVSNDEPAPAPAEYAAPAPAEYAAPAVPEPVQAAAPAPEPVSNAVSNEEPAPASAVEEADAAPLLRAAPAPVPNMSALESAGTSEEAADTTETAVDELQAAAPTEASAAPAESNAAFPEIAEIQMPLLRSIRSMFVPDTVEEPTEAEAPGAETSETAGDGGDAVIGNADDTGLSIFAELFGSPDSGDAELTERAESKAAKPEIQNVNIHGKEARDKLFALLGSREEALPEADLTRVVHVALIPEDEYGSEERLDLLIYGDFVFYRFDQPDAGGRTFQAGCPLRDLEAFLQACAAADLPPSPTPSADPFAEPEPESGS